MKKYNRRMKEFETFVNTQNNSSDDDEIYKYSDLSTIENRFSNLLCGSKSRLKNTFNTFVRTKKGTCWELAISYDYYLLEKGIKNHHIVAVETSSVTCHTFNIYVKDNKLHIIDLFKKFKDTTVDSFNDFQNILAKMYNKNYEKWYVVSEVKNNFSENFKRLGCKKIAKFSSKTKEGGGFVVINEAKQTFEVNDTKSVAWKSNSFKFPTFG